MSTNATRQPHIRVFLLLAISLLNMRILLRLRYRLFMDLLRCVFMPSPTDRYKNSSGDEIANVKFFNDDIAHLLQNTKKRTYFV